MWLDRPKGMALHPLSQVPAKLGKDIDYPAKQATHIVSKE